MYNIFNNLFLCYTANNLFPSQQQADTQPELIVVDRHDKYNLEEILDICTKRPRDYSRPQKQYLYWWNSYTDPTWEPEEYVKNIYTIECFQAAK